MSDPTSPSPPDEIWDEGLAAEVLGKLVVLGITHLQADGSLERQEQFHGRVIEADRERGIVFRLEGSAAAGEIYRLPPDTRGIDRAAPGEYWLRSTGETVRNPDFTCTWTVTARAR